MNLGAFIGKTLREKGVTLYFLAKATGISYAYLLAIEKGQRTNPSYNKLKAIAQALEVDIHELLTAAGLENNGSTATVRRTVSDKVPQRIPVIPWTWFADSKNILEALTDHSFRQYKYTELKQPQLYAIECAKDVDMYVQGTTLIVQLNTKPQTGERLVIKTGQGLGIYKVSELGSQKIAIPVDVAKPSLTLEPESSDLFIAVVKEAVIRY